MSPQNLKGETVRPPLFAGFGKKVFPKYSAKSKFLSPTLLSLEIDIDTELIGSPISLTATFNGTRPSAE